MKSKLKRWISVMLAAALLIPSGWLVAPVAAEAAKKDIPVILYHKIIADPSNNWTDTSIEKFESTMQYLVDNGYTTLSSEEYVNIMQGKETKVPEKPILLTFDDGTPDFVTNVLPTLNKHNMKAVLFVVSGWIGGGYAMTEAQLKEINANHKNISLENHTVNHEEKNVNKVSYWKNVSKEDAANEIAEANAYIKELSEKEPVLLAYPYGDFSDNVIAAAKENGILYAFKAGSGNDSDHAMGRVYVKTETTLSQIASSIGGPAPEPTKEVTVYRETFANGQGKVKAAGSKVEVQKKEFEGNDNGAAIYVSDRSANWNGVDVDFEDANMENGKTYTITVKGYVDEGVTVPKGAEIFVQNIETYMGLDLSAPMVAGEAFVASGSHTVDTTTPKYPDYANGAEKFDVAFRIQSNDAGDEVPFYIGEILVTTESAPVVEPDDGRDPAIPFVPITFEDGDASGFVGRKGDETLTVTEEANHTEGGKYALKVEGRTENWHGPTLNVAKYVDKGQEYKVSAWVKLIEPASATLNLSTQFTTGGNPDYPTIQEKTVTSAEGWVKLEGTHRYNNFGDENISIYIQASDSATASFYIDDITFEPVVDTGTVGIEHELPSLKDVYKDYFLIGNISSHSLLSGINLDMLKKHYNLLSAENDMKPEYAYNEEGEFDFTSEDQLVKTSLENKFKIHGHVLVWHAQSRKELYTDEDGKPLSRDKALENLKTHIETVVEHFGDKVISWDVVNEAMLDNPPATEDWRDALRTSDSGWYQAIGPDFIEYAFRYTREVIDKNGWDIKLYYNDFNDDSATKSDAIYEMVKELNDKYMEENNGKKLIEGIGMQSHYNLYTNPINVRNSMEKFIKLGVEIGVTELDVTAGTNSVLTEKEAQQQAYLYAQLFKIYKENYKHITRVTFWGINDRQSWRTENNPLLFDKYMKAKPAYYAVLDPDKFIEEYEPDVVNAKQSEAAYGTPTIDGEVDDIWSKAVELPIEQTQQARQVAKGTAKVMWDEENLYVLVQVNDTKLDKSASAEHEQDSVEVFVDQKNGKATFYQDGDGQYRVNFDNEVSLNVTGSSEGFVSKTKVNGTKYTVEMKIPFTEITPVKDAKIGFDVQINDAEDGVRKGVNAWNDATGRGYTDPSVFGILKLVKEGAVTPEPNPGSGYTPPVNPVDNNKITPSVRMENNQVIGRVSADQLKNAIAKATADASGKKEVVVTLTKQANATGYNAELPVQGLQNQDNVVVNVVTDLGTVTLTGAALLAAADKAEQLTVRIASGSADKLSDADKANVGTHPVIEVSALVGNKPVNAINGTTVSIPYTPSAEEANNTAKLVVWNIDENGKATAISNGRYDAAAKALVFETNTTGTFAVAFVDNAFEDISVVPWAKQAIDAMAARGIIEGTSATSYAPQESVNRADFISLLVRTLELKAKGNSPVEKFSDVETSAKYYNDLVIARSLGIATGYGDNSFKPAGEISRQDMMVLTVRALSAAGITLNGSGSLNEFSDANNVSAYAQAQTKALIGAGIINGKNGKIAPKDALTRAEVAVILYRIWDL